MLQNGLPLPPQNVLLKKNSTESAHCPLSYWQSHLKRKVIIRNSSKRGIHNKKKTLLGLGAREYQEWCFRCISLLDFLHLKHIQ